GAPVSISDSLAGVVEGAIPALLLVHDAAGNTFNAGASTQLEQSLGKAVTVSFADANVGQAKAASEPFTVIGLGSDDNGAITFSDGNPAHNVVVNIDRKSVVYAKGNLPGRTDGVDKAERLGRGAA